MINLWGAGLCIYHFDDLLKISNHDLMIDLRSHFSNDLILIDLSKFNDLIIFKSNHFSAHSTVFLRPQAFLMYSFLF